jgi:tetratricopeptide (TPR) repeat protein
VALSQSLDPILAATIATARDAVLKSPQSAERWGKLGQCFHAADFFSEARTCYARAASLDPLSPQWAHLLGLLQLQEQPESALIQLARAADLAGPQSDAPRLRLAQALVERGRFDDAARHLEFLLQANPTHPAAHLEMARIHLARGSAERVAADLATCLTNGYTARPALLLLAQIRQREGNTDEAATLARRASAMPRPFDWPDPFLRDVQGLRGDRQKLADQANGLLMQQRLPQAETVLGRLLALEPENPEALLLLGRLRYQQRQYPEAEAAFRRHLAVEPKSLNGLMQLALAQLSQSRWKEGSATLREVITLKPDFAQAHANLALALSKEGDAQGAIRSYRDALRSSPGDVNVHIALADELSRANQPAEAREHARRASELAPNDPRARQLLDRLNGQ